MSPKYEKLKFLLQELFQLDQPDLDFGIYRIMHAKADEITAFLDKDLLPQVKAAFGEYKSADKADLQRELEEMEASLVRAKVDPEQSSEVLSLRDRVANEAVDVTKLEGEVYDHLFSFFRRYYSEGDFLSKRVYKAGVYSIPYEGEEVKLHWANADQYYVKTSEYLRDYAFRLNAENVDTFEDEPMRVHFRLVDAAEGEHGNVKEAEGKARVFILAAEDFINFEDGEANKELVISFEYRPATLSDWPVDERDGKKKPPIQRDLTEVAESCILAVADASILGWINELRKTHIKADGEVADYSRLRAHLNRYTARNTFDYFIHKDLGGFLRREMDFYIKNEVMHLDDIESDTVPRVEQYLSKIKVIRSIAHKIINFLAQLEDFQKKLWLKKKFVVSTNYCITVDLIPEKFYPRIIANDEQRKEWIKLFRIDELVGNIAAPTFTEPLTTEFLKANANLILDTVFFDDDFVTALLETVEALHEQTQGILFNSENFQALNLMETRFRQRIEHVYIDPPYNTDSTPIIYKNGYRDSSWISLMADRIDRSMKLLTETGVKTIAIDDTEMIYISMILRDLVPLYRLSTITVVHNPKGSITKDFNRVHEYALFLTPEAVKDCIVRTPEKNESPRKMRRWGENSLRTERRLSFYPIYVLDGKVTRVGQVPDNEFHPTCRSIYLDSGETEIWPIDQDGTERRWNFGLDTIGQNLDRMIVQEVDETLDLFLTHEMSVPKTVWGGGGFDAGKYGNTLLIDILGNKLFDFPKSINLMEKCIETITTRKDNEHFVLDYFGGSGTTAHAVINLNRKSDIKRKFLIVEMGQYFETVTKPRIQKVIYSKNWKEGKPVDRKGLSQIFKYIQLESYEDALNNLELRRTTVQDGTLFAQRTDGTDGFREQYMLRYMLDVESRGSQSLLNIQQFADPTAYKLKVKRPGSDESREVNVDLIETFNWLIGLTVQHIAAPSSFSASFTRDAEGRLQIDGRLKQDADGPFWFRTITGTKPDGSRTLVVWRKLTGDAEQDNLVLDTWLKDKLQINPRDQEFELIYVNGDNNLENLRAADETWKVRLIEEDFHRLMFDTEDV